MTTLVDETITAANTFTTVVRFDGNFNFGISGTLSAGTTVTVQRSTDSSTWVDVDTFTSLSQNVGFEPEVLYYRAGCKTGEFTGGDSVNLRIGRAWVANYQAICPVEFLDIMKAIWPMLVVFVTVVVVLAKMHGDIEIIKDKIKTLFALWNNRDKK